MHIAYMLMADNMAHADDEAFLRDYDPERYPRPSVTVDAVLIAAEAGVLRTVVVRRTEPPHRGRWALPGGFLRLDESLDAAAARVLREKAGVRDAYLEQLYTFGSPRRDPRTRVISVAYYGLLSPRRWNALKLAEGARKAAIAVPWAGEAGGPVEATGDDGKPLALAFDHREILGTAVKRLRGKLRYAPIAYELLPETFTLLDLQRVHETILGTRLNKDSFRRRMLASAELEPAGAMQEGVGHRPAALYRARAQEEDDG
jgi:8-oxo-dGTP diphosphatase